MDMSGVSELTKIANGLGAWLQGAVDEIDALGSYRRPLKAETGVRSP
jgi:hypothetical protein